MIIAVVAVSCLLLSVTQAVVRGSGPLSYGAAAVGAISIPLLTSGPIADNLDVNGVVLAVAIALLIVHFCLHLAQRVLAHDPRYKLTHAFVVVVTSAFGTRFTQANLTRADFTEAQLPYSDLRAACLDYGRWDGALGLALVRWGSQPLSHPVVRDLLVWRRFRGSRDLGGANLTGTDLSDLDLRQANLRGASLLRANVRGSDLSEANLTLVQGLGADFTGATLTGACIEGWAIDGNTRLSDVDCRFIYRRQQGTDNRDRIPSSGEFEPGDFTKLFEVVLNTVELIFRNGVDRDAIAKTLEQVRTSFDHRIKLQGIEDKGDGFFRVSLGIPDSVNKSDLHRQFKQLYQTHLQRLESLYQDQLRSAQQQIEHYQQTTTELTQLLQQVTSHSPPAAIDAAKSDRCVTLTFWDGSLEQGYPISADLRTSSLAEPLKFHASLPPAPDLAGLYQRWQTLYRQTFSNCSRIQFETEAPITNLSHQELHLLAEQLGQALQTWLQSPSFRLIADKLREKFSPEHEIRVVIQTEDIWLRRLPWHLWQFLHDYPKAEVALSGMVLERVMGDRPLRLQPRILAILGHSTGIDVSVDQQLLASLGDANVEVIFLEEPSRQQFHDSLWDAQGWDIVYFSGHSYSQQDGHSGMIQLSPYDQISIKDLKFALAEAVNRGLQLAVLNSCDGLGLAQDLCALKIPQIVVMKEPVPDLVAQSFLDYFLRALTREQSLYTAMRAARQQLSGLEDRYPYASWLPTLFQNTVEVSLLRLFTAEGARAETAHEFGGRLS